MKGSALELAEFQFQSQNGFETEAIGTQEWPIIQVHVHVTRQVITIRHFRNETQSGASRISQSLVGRYWGQNGGQLDDASPVTVPQATARCDSSEIGSRFLTWRMSLPGWIVNKGLNHILHVLIHFPNIEKNYYPNLSLWCVLRMLLGDFRSISASTFL